MSTDQKNDPRNVPDFDPAPERSLAPCSACHAWVGDADHPHKDWCPEPDRMEATDERSTAERCYGHGGSRPYVEGCPGCREDDLASSRECACCDEPTCSNPVELRAHPQRSAMYYIEQGHREAGARAERARIERELRAQAEQRFEQARVMERNGAAQSRIDKREVAGMALLWAADRLAGCEGEEQGTGGAA